MVKDASLPHQIDQLLQRSGTSYDLMEGFEFGGFARFSPELINFINQFGAEHGIQLDPIYTGKLFYGLIRMIESGYFPSGSSIVVVHTGGLQGIDGFNQRFGNIIRHIG